MSTFRKNKLCPHPKTCPVESKQCNGSITDLCADRILVEYYVLKIKMDDLVGDYWDLQCRYKRVCSELASLKGE